MKKFLVILLMLVYGYSATGMTLHLHYCCGKLKSIEWSPVSDNECGEKHNMGTKPCCETKQISSSKSTDQAYSLTVTDPVKFSKAAIVVYADPTPVSIHTTVPARPGLAQSPPHSAAPLFVQFCVFRI
ncbi:MAG TPA: hypothetical protein VFX73_13070 [Chitinophagaceae bacterium]|nr:hypothetical protein [Chitinophagaceae bacterium]